MKYLSLLAALLLAGRSSSPAGTFQNRVVVTVDMTKVLSVSKYGRVGVSADVDEGDAGAIIEGIRARIAASISAAMSATLGAPAAVKP